MSEFGATPSGELRIVAALGREFDRVIEREPAQRRALPWSGTRKLAVVCAVALLAFTLLTPPGREAAAWVGDVVGIGEVGGPPTEDVHGLQEPDAQHDPVVTDNGRSPDGTRYEWVAYRCEVDLRGEGQPGSPVRGLSLALEWPNVEKRHGSFSCEDPRGRNERIPVFTSFDAEIVPSQVKGVKRPDVVVSGTVSAAAARRVRLIYRDGRGRRQDLSVDFARVTGPIRERGPRGAPRATFVAFIDGERASRDRLKECLDLRGVQTGRGNRAFRRCARVNPLVRVFRARRARCTAGARRPTHASMDRMARCIAAIPTPLTAIVYDGKGRQIGRQRYPFHVPLRRAPRRVGKPGYRGRGNGKRGRPPLHPGGEGRPVVLLSGRTPDGVPYEYLAQKFRNRRGRIYSVCLMHWFPYSREPGGSGHCGPGYPTTRAYGKAWPRRVVARTFGFLNDGEPATAHLSLEGFARPQVARVRVIHKDGKGGWRDAPVEFARVRGALRERVGSAEPFGFFVAFLPRSMRRYYGGPGDRASGPPAIEVLAYDDGGKQIGRFKHRN
jgi:hypothetical protein